MIENNFSIDSCEYSGDFNLKLTLMTGQTSQVPWTRYDDAYYEVLCVDGCDILVKIKQENVNNTLEVSYFSREYDVDDELVRQKLFYLFDLDYQMDDFYGFLDENPEISQISQFNKGLRIFKAESPFECIISSISSANNSRKRWTKSMQQIRQNHGNYIEYENRKYHKFPDETTFLKIAEEDLKSYGVGYRSPYMINTTKQILEDDNFHNEIFNMTYPDAYKKLLQLPGVGPKVADCILLYGYDKPQAYPTDVWINRITTHIYFDDAKISNKKIMKFAQEKFGKYAGYVQLYLFNYARNSKLLDKLKK